MFSYYYIIPKYELHKILMELLEVSSQKYDVNIHNKHSMSLPAVIYLKMMIG